MEISKSDGNAPAEKDGEKKPQNKHGKKSKGSNVEIAKRKDGKVPAKVPDDAIQKELGDKPTKASAEKASAAGTKRYIGEISEDKTDTTLVKTRPKRRAAASTRLADQQT